MTAATEGIQFELNGVVTSLMSNPAETLLTALRERLDLTGTKRGCDDEGQCGSCTVIVDGRAVRACLTPMAGIAGRRVTTIEGLRRDGTLHPLQQAFIDHGAVQCGFCTPGMIMSAKALLDRRPRAGRDEIKRALQGNLCRCTGYAAIVDAVSAVAAANGRELARSGESPSAAIGGDLRRQNARARVTGGTRYAGDMKLPGMLHARVLRSAHAHARIVALDCTPALTLPGVQAVFTAADIPGEKSFPDVLDLAEAANYESLQRRPWEPVLAYDRVRMVGEPIAIVVADDEASAQEGVEAIQVNYEPLEPIFDPGVALDRPAVPLHPNGNQYELDRVAIGEITRANNIPGIRIVTDYATASQDHVTIEPEAMVATIDEDGRLTVFGPTQQPHVRQAQIAAMLDIPADRVRVIAAEMGGSFGGRHYFWPVVAIALPAFLLRRPVRLVFSRREVFQATLKRHPFGFNMTIGADGDGRLQELAAQAIGDAGPYGGAPGIASLVTLSAIGPYRWPAIDFQTRVAHTNGANSGPFRGYGLPQGAFALECSLDELCRRLQIDPLEFRLLNAVDNASGTAMGHQFDDPFAFRQVLETARPEWEAMRREKRQLQERIAAEMRVGVGLAAAWYRYSKAGTAQVTAAAGLQPSGQITLYFSAVRAGQGLDTVMTQLAAHELGVPRHLIAVVNGDTAKVISSEVYGGCRSTYWIGGAVQQAARGLKAHMLATAAEMLDASPDTLCLTGNGVHVREREENCVTFGQIAAEWAGNGQPPFVRGVTDLRHRMPESASDYALGHFVVGVALAQVQVNICTGKVKTLRVVVAQDVGKAINPVDLRGQIEGAIVMEMGAAVTEEYVPGETMDLKRYRIPRVSDVPDMKILLVEDASRDGPHGAKGAGEAVMGHVRAAIVNAIYDATGARVRRIPATPARVLAALAKAKSG